MTNEQQMPTEGAAGGGRGSRGSERTKWIWGLLIVAILGVLMARQYRPGACAPPRLPSPPGSAPSAPAPEVATQGETLPRLVDLGAAKCIPCKLMAPIVEDLKKTYAGKMDVQFIDVSENPDAVQKYGIGLIPTQIFYDAAGKELFRHEGFFGKEDILATWKDLGVELSAANTEPPR